MINIIEQSTKERELEDETNYREFIEYYNNTNLSITNICRKMGISPGGGPYSRIRKQMKQNNDEDPRTRGARIRRKNKSRITVISQTTPERHEETLELYRQVKPLLDEGIPLYKAVAKVKDMSPTNVYVHGWFKDLRAYVTGQGK